MERSAEEPAALQRTVRASRARVREVFRAHLAQRATEDVRSRAIAERSGTGRTRSPQGAGAVPRSVWRVSPTASGEAGSPLRVRFHRTHRGGHRATQARAGPGTPPPPGTPLPAVPRPALRGGVARCHRAASHPPNRKGRAGTLPPACRPPRCRHFVSPLSMRSRAWCPANAARAAPQAWASCAPAAPLKSWMSIPSRTTAPPATSAMSEAGSHAIRASSLTAAPSTSWLHLVEQFFRGGKLWLTDATRVIQEKISPQCPICDAYGLVEPGQQNEESRPGMHPTENGGAESAPRGLLRPRHRNN